MDGVYIYTFGTKTSDQRNKRKAAPHFISFLELSLYSLQSAIFYIIVHMFMCILRPDIWNVIEYFGRKLIYQPHHKINTLLTFEYLSIIHFRDDFFLLTLLML